MLVVKKKIILYQFAANQFISPAFIVTIFTYNCPTQEGCTSILNSLLIKAVLLIA